VSDTLKEYEFKKLGARLSNWGRWGEDDQLGTVNFITPEVRKAAAGLVRSGQVFDLGMPFGMTGRSRVGDDSIPSTP
jgi:hypothetical protein